MSIEIDSKDLGIRVTNVLPRKQQNKHSGFFITINTNFHPKGNEADAEECAEKLRSAAKALFSEEERLKHIVNFLPKTDGNTDAWGTDTIKKVSSEFVIERGRSPRGGRIHLHATLQIEHTSKIRLNIPAIKEEVLPFFAGGCTCDIKNLYINVKAIRQNQGIRNYLTKEN